MHTLHKQMVDGCAMVERGRSVGWLVARSEAAWFFCACFMIALPLYGCAAMWACRRLLVLVCFAREWSVVRCTCSTAIFGASNFLLARSCFLPRSALLGQIYERGFVVFLLKMTIDVEIYIVHATTTCASLLNHNRNCFGGVHSLFLGEKAAKKPTSQRICW